MDIIAKFVTPGLVFFLALAFGMRLSRAGKPLNAAIFTAHKLIALAALIVGARQTFNVLHIVGVQPVLIGLLIAVALAAVALFVTGALMSLNRPGYGLLQTIHKVASPAALAAALLALYLLGGGAGLFRSL